MLFVEQNSKIALTTAQRGYVLQTGHMILTDTCESLLHVWQYGQSDGIELRQ